MNSFMQNLEPAKQFADPTQPKNSKQPKKRVKILVKMKKTQNREIIRKLNFQSTRGETPQQFS